MEISRGATFRVSIENPFPFVPISKHGLLPLEVHQQATVGLDRNVLSFIRCNVTKPSPARELVLRLARVLRQSKSIVNPALSAFEGEHRRAPTRAEFFEDTRSASDALSSALGSDVVRSPSSEYLESAYLFRSGFDARLTREIEFLRAIAPRLANPVASTGLCDTHKLIISQSERLSLRGSIVELTALSVLYEATEKKRFARGVLRPRKNYGAEEAYNAISDVRQLELLAAATALPRECVLLTGDWSLARLWTALDIVDVELTRSRGRITFGITSMLVPRWDKSRHPSINVLQRADV